MKRPAASWIALLLAAAGSARAQILTPNTTVPVPEVGRFVSEIELSDDRASAFVDIEGSRQRFPGTVDFGLGVLRISYAPFSRFAVGATLPYRVSRYRLEGLPGSFTNRGSPGVGVFLDWAAGGPAAAIPVTVRLGYLHARTESDQILTVSDGLDRYYAIVSAATRIRPGRRFQARALLEAEYGPPVEAEPNFFSGQVELSAGPSLTRVGSSELTAQILGGYRYATAARQEGSFLHNRKSRNGMAGLLLSLEDPAARGIVPRSLALSVAFDAFANNALTGWRATLSFRNSF